jgi:uncharacterized zinc-type alcohol dehydrogenase-like protein
MRFIKAFSARASDSPSPLRHWKVGPGPHTVGVVGIGWATWASSWRMPWGVRGGTHHVRIQAGGGLCPRCERGRGVAQCPREMAAHAKRFDFILNTVAAPHDLDPFFGLLKRDGTMALVGAPATPHPSPQVFSLIMKRRSLAGSMIGGIPETQEMLDFCAEHGIVADIEMIRADEVNEVYERMLKGDVKYRFVIDNASLAI